MITLELGAAPARPLSLNRYKGMHWADVRRHTDPWKILAWVTATNVSLADVVGGVACEITVHIPVPDKRHRDPHNM